MVIKCLNLVIFFCCLVYYCFGVLFVLVVFIYICLFLVIFVNFWVILIMIIFVICENLLLEIEKNNIYMLYFCNIGWGNIFIYLIYCENKLNIF